MPSIDNRVVQMTFDNAAFERKLATTSQSLANLNKQLNLSGAVKGIEDVHKSIGKFNLGGVEGQIDSVSKKFIALSAIAVSALASITTKAIDAGIKIGKALSVDRLMDGFREYETNMKSIQTIMANSGAPLEDVNRILDEMNEYSDKTIYNFAEMARNVGTFTAAGVDLDVAATSIKGIANMAAISGSSSEQAATAMYQLSQAIASGSVKLMDWNSVVNAGMGGEIFQRALFESGKALGQINDIPLSTTFDQWKEQGNSFRDSLKSGWLTADVLTTTLGGISGELDQAELAAKGFSQGAQYGFLMLGATGVAAATEVRTFTQLIQTVKESIGSGWSESFRTIIGDFNQATELFTSINTVIGNFVKKNADARNALLKGWAGGGGRLMVIWGIRDSFKALLAVLKPIKEAFRTVFPPTTSATLVKMSLAFYKFSQRLQPTGATLDKLRIIFLGFFRGIQIVGTIIKGVAAAFRVFWKALTLGSKLGGGVLDFFVGIAQKINLASIAVRKGDALTGFFKSLTQVLRNAGTYLRNVGQDVAAFVEKFVAWAKIKIPPGLAAIGDFLQMLGDKFSSFAGKLNLPNLDGISDLLGRFKDRFGGLTDGADKVQEDLKKTGDRLGGFGDKISTAWDKIKEFFKDIGGKIAEAMGEGDFNAALDVINVGLFGGLLLLIKKFLDGGIKMDFSGGLLPKLGGLVDGLTNHLKIMQTEIKADILIKIAAAVGILALSLLVLSMIDSVKLAGALAAMTVGIGQLMTVMTLLGEMKPKSGVSGMIGLAATMLILTGALLLLSFAVKIFASMDPADLAKGMAGVTGSIAILMTAMQLINDKKKEMTEAGATMLLMAGAMLVLSFAIKTMGDLSPEQLATGLAGVAAGLGIMVGALHLMPKGDDMLKMGAAIFLIGLGLDKMAIAINKMSALSWEQLAKGLGGVAAGLLIIAAALRFMPSKVEVALSAAALYILGLAMQEMAKAVIMLGTLPFEQLRQGLVGIALTLALVVAAVNLMQGALLGAVALIIVAQALQILLTVVQEFAKISIMELIGGLAGMAAVIAVLGGISYLIAPLVPAMILLGIALTAVGIGFALFGAGAYLAALAFGQFVKYGKDGIDVFMYALEQLAIRIPELIRSFVLGFIEGLIALGGAINPLIDLIGGLLGKLLDLVIKLAPKLADVIIVVIRNLLKVVRGLVPDFVETGIAIVIALFGGLQRNIRRIADLALDIITGFMDTLSEHIDEIVQMGVKFMTSLMSGIASNMVTIVSTAVDIILTFVRGLADNANKIAGAGSDLMIALIKGLAGRVADLALAAVDLIVLFIDTLAEGYVRIIDAGADFLIKILEGIAGKIPDLASAAAGLITTFITEVGAKANDIAKAGTDVVVKLIEGFGTNLNDVVDAGTDTLIKFLEGVAKNIAEFATNALIILTNLLAAIRAAVDNNGPKLRSEALHFVGSLINFIGGGLPGKVAELAGKIASFLKDAIKRAVGWVPFAGGILDKIFGSGGGDKIPDNIELIAEYVESMPEFTPVITPILDLSDVEKEATRIGSLLAFTQTVGLSSNQSRQLASISSMMQPVPTEPVIPPAPTEIRFEQIINAPKQLSTADIYRQTRNQITLAKEALSIP